MEDRVNSWIHQRLKRTPLFSCPSVPAGARWDGAGSNKYFKIDRPQIGQLLVKMKLKLNKVNPTIFPVQSVVYSTAWTRIAVYVLKTTYCLASRKESCFTVIWKVYGIPRLYNRHEPNDTNWELDRKPASALVQFGHIKTESMSYTREICSPGQEGC